MIKQDLIEHLLDLEIPRAHATLAVNEVVSKISEALSNGDSVYLRGLGTLKVRTAKAKTARDIRRGVFVTVPERRSVKFIPSKAILSSLNESPHEKD